MKVCWALALFLLSSGAQAETGLADVLAHGSSPGLERAFFQAGGRFVASVQSPEEAWQRGLVPVTRELAVGRATASELSQLTRQGLAVNLPPPRRTQLERAAQHQNAVAAEAEYGLDGAGVFAALVDTGVSIAHPDLRQSDGRTRIAWLLTFDEGPRGLQPELEQQYRCASLGCAILSRSDIDEILQSGTEESLLIDSYGHGTHVASTMAGSGQTYRGVAPASDLIVVQAGGGTGSIADAEILLGAKFAFDRAEAAGRPLVLNLSLGSSFGPHDGTTSLETGLAELGAGPGRAIVVASGNSGGVYSLKGSALPEPLGIHTEASVRSGATTHVTMATAYAGTGQLSVFGYVSTHPSDDVEIAFRGGNGEVSAFASRNRTVATSSKELGDAGDYEVALVNGADQMIMDLGEGSLAFFWIGRVQGGGEQEILFRGNGNVRIWVESTLLLNGAATPGAVLVPRARTSGTVAIPASHPDLITVGASVNRASWHDYEENLVTVDEVVDGVATFSAAGPNQLGQIKPDLLAPGSNLIAAMAAEADPRSGASSQFSAQGTCPPGTASECYVVDDTHGVSSGTSMAAPQVSGAIALLFQRDPELTMDKARELMRGGARAPKDEGFPSNWYGAGNLDIFGTLLAQDALVSPGTGSPSRSKSRLSVASSFLYPDETLSVEAIALLRDDEDRPVAIDPNDYRVITSGASAEIIRSSPGVLTMLLRAPRGSGGTIAKLQLLHKERELLSVEFPVGIDPTTAVLGYDVQAGCVWARGRARPFASSWLLLVPCLVWLRRRRANAE